MLKVIVGLLSIVLLPITAVPAEAKVCTWKSRQIKNYKDQAYTKYEYVTKRVCK